MMRNPKADGWPAQGAKTEDEDIARKWAWDYVAYYRDGIRRNLLGLGPRPKKLEDAIQEFLDHREVVVEPNTWSSDRTAMAHMQDWFKNAKTTDITAGEIQKFVNARVKAGYAIGSIRTLLTSVGPFLKFVGLEGLASGIELPNREVVEAHAWSDEQIDDLRKAAKYVARTRSEREWPDPRMVLDFFLASGCRQQEGYAAEWKRIDYHDKTIRLLYQLDRNTNEMRILKGKLGRTVILLKGFLENWYDESAKGLILGKPNGKPLGYRSQVNLLTRIFDAAQLKEYGVGHHSLRHTYARQFLEQTESLTLLQEMLGHKSIKTTEQEYKHFTSSTASKLARQRIYGLRAV